MSNRSWWFVCLMALALSAGLVHAGRVDANPSLESVARLWGDLMWDTSRAAVRLVHVSAPEEMRLGAKLAAAVGLPEDAAESAYATSVGHALTTAVQRHAIAYQFHVVRDPSVNAFALPGGQVFVTTGLLGFLESEAELAAVIGHEMAHIDLQHCLDQYRYEAALGENDAARLADFIRQAHARAYSQQQEYDADSRGVLYALSSGYDPTAAARVFRRLARQESAGPASGLLAPYLQSHPSNSDRATRLDAIIAAEAARLGPKQFYVGVTNLRKRTPLSHRVADAEWTVLPQQSRQPDRD